MSSPKPDAKIRVCVVDDDERMLETLTQAIHTHPDLSLLACAHTLAQAYEMLDLHSPNVVLVDLGLPDGNGLELIRYIHANRPGCESMVFTVFGDESHVIASIEAGATGYLTKDTRTEDIVSRLLQLHAGGSPISPVIARRLLTRFRALQPDAAPDNSPRLADAKHSQAPATLVTPLSDREMQVLEMVAKGFMQSEIADLMQVSINTVSTYIKRIYRKLAVNSRTSAVHRASELGLINLRERP
ncbi:response regulator transcription factor [Limnobacter humi]|uniref:Response regulator transcription factor n=1 Tax=Limnobacter humi TaxID=1778671 RepID=A0ABT1WJQ4_9BURK|nr:response regulator transcription factor [Limnobacter humi]MCQ8897629.1 response regulator transcription factor [Limnobacter humi]